MGSGIKEEDLGLKPLYDGSAQGYRLDIDIVAIHGMGAHPDRTWCSRANGINWLEDSTMLPAAIPNSRIMRYGYMSEWFGPGATKTKVPAISRQLLPELVEERRHNPFRPLVFIAHSFGGLVVLRTLLEAYTHYPDIWKSTVGLVFLGTPFRGTDDVFSNGDIPILAEERFGERPVYSENLQILRRGDETLITLVDDYLRLAKKGRMPQVACFYEQRDTNVGAVLGKDPETVNKRVTFVDETSGCLDISAVGNKYALPRDHFDINKFGTPQEQSFKIVWRVICEMDDNLLGLRNTNPQIINQSL